MEQPRTYIVLIELIYFEDKLKLLIDFYSLTADFQQLISYWFYYIEYQSLLTIPPASAFYFNCFTVMYRQ